MKHARRPISSAASFFRSDAGNKKKDSPGGNKRESLAHPIVGTKRPGLEASVQEREELFDLFPLIVSHLLQVGLDEDGLFVKDPSANNQEAMMGLHSNVVREQVRAVRRLLDALPNEREKVLNEFGPHAWAGAIKVCLKEMTRPILPPRAATELLRTKDKDSIQGKIVLLKQIVETVQYPEKKYLCDLFLLLNRCRTENEKLGFMFSALLVLPHIAGDQPSNIEVSFI